MTDTAHRQPPHRVCVSTDPGSGSVTIGPPFSPPIVAPAKSEPAYDGLWLSYDAPVFSRRTVSETVTTRDQDQAIKRNGRERQ